MAKDGHREEVSSRTSKRRLRGMPKLPAEDVGKTEEEDP
jgi:hypothetical protein